MNINQDQLIIFITVMETGSFSAAARQLGKVPSAISMSIANLEIDLDLKLFERIGREPLPTPQAQSLYEKSKQTHRNEAVETACFCAQFWSRITLKYSGGI